MKADERWIMRAGFVFQPCGSSCSASSLVNCKIPNGNSNKRLLGVGYKSGQELIHACWVIHDECHNFTNVPEHLRPCCDACINFRQIPACHTCYYIQHTLPAGRWYWAQSVIKSLQWNQKLDIKTVKRGQKRIVLFLLNCQASCVTWEWKMEW